MGNLITSFKRLTVVKGNDLSIDNIIPMLDEFLVEIDSKVTRLDFIHYRYTSGIIPKLQKMGNYKEFLGEMETFVAIRYKKRIRSKYIMDEETTIFIEVVRMRYGYMIKLKIAFN